MIKNSIKKIIVASILTVMTVGIMGCGAKSQSTSSAKNNNSIETIKKRGKLILGTSADYPPYEFHQNVNGKDEIVGFDIEIAKELSKDLGVELEIKDMKFDGLLAALQSGNVDMVLAGMNPTEERKQSVDFSKVYYTSELSVIVRKEDKNNFINAESLKGKKIGVQKGTVQEKAAKEQIKGANIKSLGRVTDLILEINNKKVDAVVIETPVAKSYAKNNNGLDISNVKVVTEDNGSAVAVKKGSQELISSMNKTIDKLMKNKTIDKYVTEANEKVK